MLKKRLLNYVASHCQKSSLVNSKTYKNNGTEKGTEKKHQKRHCPSHHNNQINLCVTKEKNESEVKEDKECYVYMFMCITYIYA
jgi:hypothetical protein